MKNIIKKRLKIAIPNKGRLSEPSLILLKKLGLEFEEYERKLSTTVKNFDLEILFISANNIPKYVQNGIVDLGITGLDLVKEKKAKIEVIEKLGFGKADLVIAAPQNKRMNTLKHLQGKKIATSFVNTTKTFLAKNKIKAKVIEVDGAIEITPWLGLVDAVADLSSSGSTLKVNKLKPFVTIISSEAVLIGNKKSLKNKDNGISQLLIRFESVLTADKKRYIMMNAPKTLLPKIKKIAPGLNSPTVMPLSQKGMIAVHSVINKNDVGKIIEDLKKIGASGILIIPIEKMVN